MRDIKLRAWVKPIQIFANRQYGYMIDVSVINFEEKWVSDDEETVYEFHEIELMQYTGMKDVKGVEIYEGDIVKASSRGIWGKFQVKWRQDGSPCWFMYPAWKSGVAWSLHGTLNDKGEYRDDVEVIGNIYENPELLED